MKRQELEKKMKKKDEKRKREEAGLVGSQDVQVAHPVRARVELRRVCRVLDSSANLCMHPCAAAAFGEADDLGGKWQTH